MKTFIVEGNGWKADVEIDDSDYDKYKDMTSEAMAQAVAMYLHNSEDEAKSMGFILVSYEQGYKDDPNKNVVCMTKHALRNAGYYTLADEAEEALKCIIARAVERVKK